MKLIAVPLCSEINMSPTMAGLRTFDATARPVKNLAAMSTADVGEREAMIVAAMNKMLAPFITGYLPNTSDSGAMNRGPAASPSSQIVTRSTLDDLSGRPSRSLTMCVATGTTAIHVKVL
jgi:hypothetical protein